MKIIIQCAGRKFEKAGRLTLPSGEKVRFVAHPEKYILQDKSCRPDDKIEGTEITWRDYLKSYNQEGLNPNNLYSAGELYKPSIYRALVNKYGPQNVYILSAGWGLVRADFLLPYYNITFSNKGFPYSIRRLNDHYEDFNQLCDDTIYHDETIYFFGGQNYLPLYLKMTQNIDARKVIFHTHGNNYQQIGYLCIPYRSYINWHYSCAQEFIDGKFRD